MKKIEESNNNDNDGDAWYTNRNRAQLIEEMKIAGRFVILLLQYTVTYFSFIINIKYKIVGCYCNLF